MNAMHSHKKELSPEQRQELLSALKAPQVAEAFVMTVKRWIQGKSINQKIACWSWLLPWVLSF